MKFARPFLTVALPALALLPVASGPGGAEPRSEAVGGKGGPIETAADAESKPSPAPPQSAPDRPQTQPRREESPPADRGKAGSAAPLAESKPESPTTPPESKPESPTTPPESKPESPTTPPESKPESPTTPAESKPEAGAPPKNLKPITPEEAVGILGKKVHGPAGEDMGMIVDVLVDGDGRPRAAVIDFGGFLGVGSRKIAIDWELLQFRPADRTQPVNLVLGRAEVQAAPEYKPSGQPAEVVAPAPPPPELVAPDAEK
jgi:PRC-barrel domain protein